MLLEKNVKKNSNTNNEVEDPYFQLKKTCNEFKSFALSYIEKWDKSKAEHLANKFQFKKQAGQWLSIH